MRSAAVLLLRRRQSALADSSCVLGCSKVLHTSLSCAESRNRSSSADGRDWRTEAIEPIMPDIYHTQDASLSSLNPLPKAAIHRAWNDKGHRPLSSRAEYDHSAVIDSEHAADEQLPGQPTVNAHQQPQQHQQQSQQQQQWRHSPVPFMPRSWGYSSMWDQQQPWPVPTQQPQWQEQEQHLQQQQQQAQPQPDVPMLPIYAVHLGFEVDLHAFHTAHTFKRTVATSNHLLIEVEEPSNDRVLFPVNSQEQPDKRFMVIYRYGSVVFFNMKQKSRESWLATLSAYKAKTDVKDSNSSHRKPTGEVKTDETMVVVRSDFEPWSALEPDKIVVKQLDLGNVRVISHVLGQSVALHYYNDKVDQAITQFTPYLDKVAKSGQCADVREPALLKLIAENSLLYTDVVTKIGLLDISQTAWTQDRYVSVCSTCSLVN
eukprot:GHRR01007142.1.p1 GENE.GHRR01007142.1~~GHRR01007142.1.p1  ORF type:complete len:430 (+),score=105.28 GHRR01007142.1:228-1517(+)